MYCTYIMYMFYMFTVAQRVVARNVWDIMGVPLRVSFPQRKRDPLEQVMRECNPSNTIVLGNIPNGIGDEHLLLYIENITGLEENEYKLHFQGREEALLILSSKSKYLTVYSLLASNVIPFST